MGSVGSVLAKSVFTRAQFDSLSPKQVVEFETEAGESMKLGKSDVEMHQHLSLTFRRLLEDAKSKRRYLVIKEEEEDRTNDETDLAIVVPDDDNDDDLSTTVLRVFDCRICNASFDSQWKLDQHFSYSRVHELGMNSQDREFREAFNKAAKMAASITSHNTLLTVRLAQKIKSLRLSAPRVRWIYAIEGVILRQRVTRFQALLRSMELGEDDVDNTTTWLHSGTTYFWNARRTEALGVNIYLHNKSKCVEVILQLHGFQAPPSPTFSVTAFSATDADTDTDSNTVNTFTSATSAANTPTTSAANTPTTSAAFTRSDPKLSRFYLSYPIVLERSVPECVARVNRAERLATKRGKYERTSLSPVVIEQIKTQSAIDFILNKLHMNDQRKVSFCWGDDSKVLSMAFLLHRTPLQVSPGPNPALPQIPRGLVPIALDAAKFASLWEGERVLEEIQGSIISGHEGHTSQERAEALAGAIEVSARGFERMLESMRRSKAEPQLGPLTPGKIRFRQIGRRMVRILQVAKVTSILDRLERLKIIKEQEEEYEVPSSNKAEELGAGASVDSESGAGGGTMAESGRYAAKGGTIVSAAETSKKGTLSRSLFRNLPPNERMMAPTRASTTAKKSAVNKLITKPLRSIW